jgi:hypothetical protein
MHGLRHWNRWAGKQLPRLRGQWILVLAMMVSVVYSATEWPNLLRYFALHRCRPIRRDADYSVVCTEKMVGQVKGLQFGVPVACAPEEMVVRMRRQRMDQKLHHQDRSRGQGGGLKHYNWSRSRYKNSMAVPKYHSGRSVRPLRILGMCQWEILRIAEDSTSEIILFCRRGFVSTFTNYSRGGS